MPTVGPSGSARHGGVKDWEYYRSGPLVDKMAPVAAKLLADPVCAPAKPTGAKLAQLVADLIDFQESNLGVNSTTHPVVRLPAYAFEDGACLRLVFATCYQVMSEQRWAEFDFKNSGRAAHHVEIIRRSVKAFAKEKKALRRKIYLSPTLSADRQAKFKEIVKHLDCGTKMSQIVSKQDGATHVVLVVDEHELKSGEADSDYLRPLEKKNGACLVHWLYHPDSYNTWLNASDVDSEPEQLPLRPEPCFVACRWLEDSYRFNEWTLEDDYMPEPGSPAFVGNAPIHGGDSKAKKRKVDDPSNNAPGSNAKPKKAKKSGAGDTDTVDTTEQDPMRKKAKKAAAAGASGGSTTIKLPAMSQLDAKKLADPKLKKGRAVVVSTQVTDADVAIATATPQTDSLVIPSHAEWFDFDKVDDAERQHFSEFFNGRSKNKTPSIYREYRDTIINLYRQNPSLYLSGTACRRHLAGDVCSILRVHQFLEYWGLINYDFRDESRPMAHSAPSTANLATNVHAGSGSVHTLRPVVAGAGAAATFGNKTDSSHVQSLATRRNVFGQALKSPNAEPSSAEWTDLEVLRLLEAIELYGEDWNDIARHVESKTKAQCAQHFIQMPIADPYMESNIFQAEMSPFFSASADAGAVPSTLLKPRTTLALIDESNPVLSQLAALQSIVDPGVAKRAAAAAYEVINGQMDVGAAAIKSEQSMQVDDDDAVPADGQVAANAENSAVFKATAAAVSTAVKAKLLVEKEEREMQVLMADIASLQCKKLNLKTSQFNEWLNFSSRQKEEMESARIRASFQSTQMAAKEQQRVEAHKRMETSMRDRAAALQQREAQIHQQQQMQTHPGLANNVMQPSLGGVAVPRPAAAPINNATPSVFGMGVPVVPPAASLPPPATAPPVAAPAPVPAVIQEPTAE